MKVQTRGLLVLLLAVPCSHPALAQVDIAGNWQTLTRNQDGSGMTGDAAGVPVNAEGRWRAESWSPGDFDIPEWVCRPHAWDNSLEGPLSEIRFWAEVDPKSQKIVAYHGHINMMEQETTIWMDGRSHPPENAAHTWSGFSTGEWDGDTLVVTTTHLKETYIRRTGYMRSDQAVIRTRWRRMGEFLQATSIIYDPVYLAAPFIRTTMSWVNDPAMFMPPYSCEEATETAVPRGRTPHFLPGTSPLAGFNPQFADRFATPYEARRGGPETMYPEFIAKLKTFAKPTVPAPPGSFEH